MNCMQDHGYVDRQELIRDPDITITFDTRGSKAWAFFFAGLAIGINLALSVTTC